MKYPYGRKSKKWLGDKAPTASEKRAIEKELMQHADEEETKSKGQASFIRIHGKTDEITAAGYLMSLKDDELTITKDKTAHRVARHRINTFINWLNTKHRGLALHQVNSAIASDYYKYLESERLAYATIQHHIARLRFGDNEKGSLFLYYKSGHTSTTTAPPLIQYIKQATFSYLCWWRN